MMNRWRMPKWKTPAIRVSTKFTLSRAEPEERSSVGEAKVKRLTLTECFYHVWSAPLHICKHIRTALAIPILMHVWPHSMGEVFYFSVPSAKSFDTTSYAVWCVHAILSFVLSFSVQIDIAPGQEYILTGGGLPGSYVMDQMHFHWGSEHLINGQR